MLHFKSLTLENFGPYKGKQEIDFTNDDGVTIIWGNNGVGKTILLNVIRYALYGKVQGRGKKPHSLKLIGNWESFDEGKYGFKVTLTMINDGIHYELTRQFLVRNGISKPEKDSDYREDVFLKRDTSILSPEEREHVLKSIMPEQVSRFFLFDGELLQEYEDLLLDSSTVGTYIKEAIEQILGLPILTNGLVDVRDAEKEFSNRLSKIAQKNQSTQVIGNLLEIKQSERKQHEDEIASLKNTLQALIEERHEYEAVMKDTEKAREWLQSKEFLKEKIKEKQIAKEAKLAEMKLLTKNVWRGMLTQKIQNALEQLDEEIKKYDEKNNKHIISEELINQINTAIKIGICPICDQSIPDSLRQTLGQKISSKVGIVGLSTEEQEKLISLQGRRSLLVKQLNTEDLKQQVIMIERLIAEITVEISDAEQKVSGINKNLSEFGDLTRASTITNDYAKCLQKIDSTQIGLDNEKRFVDSLADEIRNLEDKLKVLASDKDLIEIERKRALCEKVMKVFESGVELYRERLKEKVEKDACDIFLRISNQKEYSALRINENYGLSIIHNSGRVVEIRSAGYEHVVALSLIGALHKNAPLQGPIIMDSPFGRLDPDHKRKITAALPTLADQVILLVYLGEIDEQIARSTLGGDLRNEYQLSSITAFNTRVNTL
jgi:DNA sulfur modification protein DndD